MRTQATIASAEPALDPRGRERHDDRTREHSKAGRVVRLIGPPPMPVSSPAPQPASTMLATPHGGATARGGWL